MSVAAHQAPYARIKMHILGKIESGEWPVNGRVPSENQLAAEFGVSRMTARRAVLELTQDGVLMRSQGIGTFVADRKPMLSMLEVRNIADEIAERGHRYSNRVVKLAADTATEAMALYLGVSPGSEIYHSIIVHLDNLVPVQLEERFTNPDLAPDYLEQDFGKETPNAYLSRIAPLGAAEHTVEAVLPSADVIEWLELTQPEACLQVNRRTWSQGQVATFARLIHPGSRYRLGGGMVVLNQGTGKKNLKRVR
jgi:GntR family histidine utilization transcriptional repressor